MLSPLEEAEAQVRAYLADCRAHRAILNPAYHPTARGCLKVVCGPEPVILRVYERMSKGRTRRVEPG